MWIFRGEVDLRLLEERLSRMGLVSEWRAFGGTVQNYQGKVSISIADRQAFVVEFLGMVVDGDDGLYDARGQWSRKARRFFGGLISVGNLVPFIVESLIVIPASRYC